MRCDIKLDAIYFRKSYFFKLFFLYAPFGYLYFVVLAWLPSFPSKVVLQMLKEPDTSTTNLILHTHVSSIHSHKLVLTLYYNDSLRFKMFRCDASLQMESISFRFFLQNDHSFKTNFFSRNWSVPTKVTLVTKIIDFREIDLLLKFLTENVSTKCVKDPYNSKTYRYPDCIKIKNLG